MMDTSKEYILMCKMAYKVMKGDQPIAPIWTQDQLQEMVKGLYPDMKIPHRMINHLQKACAEEQYQLEVRNHYLLNFTSMEQLWLAFVMKEKYNKIWNGKDWAENRGI